MLLATHLANVCVTSGTPSAPSAAAAAAAAGKAAAAAATAADDAGATGICIDHATLTQSISFSGQNDIRRIDIGTFTAYLQNHCRAYQHISLAEFKARDSRGRLLAMLSSFDHGAQFK